MDNIQPIVRFKAGAVSCALFENEIVANGQPQTLLKASVTRRYKDRQGKWHSATNLSRNEIPLAIFVLGKAFEYMLQKSSDEAGQEVSEERVI